MKILLTGATGLIGREIVFFLEKKGHTLIPVDIIASESVLQADLRDNEIVNDLISLNSPDLVIHLAAIKNIKFCEQNKEEAELSNVGITRGLVAVCKERNIRLIYFSTDYVYGAYDRFWVESDLVCPTTQYGKSKAISEAVIQKELSDYAIVRTAQLYGFKGDFISLVLQTLNAGKEFLAIDNLVNCPTWIGDLLQMLDEIIEERHQGIFHCIGPEAVSRYEYACEIARAFSLDSSKIKPFQLDFSIDIRPPVVRLNGINTYQKLQVYPKKLEINLEKGFDYLPNN